MNEGWIKIHRKLARWEWYTCSKTVHLFLHLILNANHKDGKWKGRTIKRGQLVTGRKALSAQTGISEQSIRTCLQNLQNAKNVTSKSTNKNTIITICNYDDYQGVETEANQQINQPTNQQTTNKQPATNQQLTTNKNVKNNKELKKVKNKEEEILNRENYIDSLTKEEREEKLNDFKGFLRRMWKDRQWIEHLHRTQFKSLDMSLIRDKVTEFKDLLIAREDIYKKEYQYKDHFVNWLKKNHQNGSTGVYTGKIDVPNKKRANEPDLLNKIQNRGK